MKKTSDSNVLDIVLKHISEQNDKMFEAMKDMQVEHFKQLEKSLEKPLEILVKQNELFIEFLNKKPALDDEVKPIDFERIVGEENTIEKSEKDEIPLSEMDRIPIVDGVNIKFEDEEQIFPINIEPSGNV